MPRTPRLHVGVSAVILLAGCGESASEGVDATVRATGISVIDSADIELVEVGADALDSLPEWTFSAEPTLTIGNTSGEDPYLFASVLAAVRLPSDEIVVVEGFDFEFRVFGPDGVYRTSFGGRGEGPGEFGGVMAVRKRLEGGMAAGDGELRRATLFDDQNSVEATRSSSCRVAGWYFRGVAVCYMGGLTGDDGVFWYATRRSPGPQPGTNPRAVQRSPGGIRYLGLGSGDSLVVVDSIPAGGRARIVQSLGGVPALWSVPEVFALEGHWAFGPRTVALGESDSFEIRFRDSKGALRRILRVAMEPEFVTSQDLDAIRALMGTPASISPRELALMYLDEVPAGGQIPFFGELRFDDAGRLWVADYVPPRLLLVPDTTWWTVFDEKALPLARIATGRSDDILELGEDHVLLRETDEMDVQRVAMYRIERE